MNPVSLECSKFYERLRGRKEEGERGAAGRGEGVGAGGGRSLNFLYIRRGISYKFRFLLMALYENSLLQ